MLLPISLLLSKVQDDTRKLPFGLGEYSVDQFDVLIHFILVCMIISFTSARSGTLVPYDLAHSLCDEMTEFDGVKIKQRQFFTMLSHPTLNRTGSMISLSDTMFKNSKTVRLLSVHMYRITKYTAVAITLGLPCYAIIYAWRRILDKSSFLVIGAATAFGLVALACLFYVLLAEWKHTEQVFRKKVVQARISSKAASND